ncbi:MAG: T9SS type A sorting domain-containing protein [Hymenobacteraceae bacterium]|nr:T9SS type A sorting domain-containing protein [Hymenobacteraceae bacterium]
MKKTLLGAALAAALLGIGTSTSAQSLSRWCATDEHTADLARTFHDPKLAAERKTAERLAERLQRDDVFAQAFRAQQRPAGAVRPIIPVVVHVITRCGNQSLPQSGIERGLAQLNADWNRTNSDAGQTRAAFLPYASGFNVEFRFAKLDPLGNPFNGIHRVTNLATDAINPGDLVKTAVPAWDGYFNVWIVDEIFSSTPGGIILGYAQFPGTGPWTTWGIVMRYDDWITPLANGRTASHEVGHCFNLFHSFTDGGGCGGPCASTGDMVCDTPPSASPAETCYRTRSRNTCSNDVSSGTVYTTNVDDQDENFMSYNNCQNMFTQGQKARVEATLASFQYIKNLVSQDNALRTGVADGQIVAAPGPVAYLNTCQLSSQGGELIACAGRPIRFTDASYGAPVSSVIWAFTGATTASSTLANPVVIFDMPGLQTVTLTPTGPDGPSSPLTINIRVLPTGQLVAPVAESFEAGRELTDKLWRRESSSLISPRRWQKVGLTGVNVTTQGDSAVVIANGNVPAGTTNTLFSPPFDTRNLASSDPAPTLLFDIAYARRNTTSNDELRVSFSVDCGRTWTLRRTLTGTALSTTGSQLIPAFVPTALTQWRTESIDLTGAFLNQAGLMIRFESTSAASGNNLYLDNIRLDGRPLGVANELAAVGVTLSPNPLTIETGLRFSLAQTTRVAVRVADVLGRPVLTDAPRTLAPGAHQLPVAARLRGVAAGVYVVSVELDGRVYSQKLLIQ